MANFCGVNVYPVKQYIQMLYPQLGTLVVKHNMCIAKMRADEKTLSSESAVHVGQEFFSNFENRN